MRKRHNSHSTHVYLLMRRVLLLNVDTFMLILSTFSWLSRNSNLFVKSSACFLLNTLYSAIISSPNFLNYIYWYFIKFVYEASDSFEGSSRHTVCIYVWMCKQDHYECPEIRFIPVKISSFQIIKKNGNKLCFFFFTEKIAEIWHVRNVQGGRLTEGVEVG